MTTSLNVLMLGWEFPPHISGGLGTACKGLVDGLTTREVPVTFVVPRLDPELSADDPRVVDCGLDSSGPNLVPVASALLPYLTEEQYRRLAVRRSASGSVAATLLEEVERYARAVDDNTKGVYQIVHAHDWMTVPAAIAVSGRLQIPFVFHVHSTEYDRAGESANRDIAAIEQRGLDAAARVICVSRYTTQQVRSRYQVDPEKLRVVHNAVAPSSEATSMKPLERLREPIVLFLARVTFQKGPNYFLEAAARVVAQEPRVKFVMAGGGDLLPAMIERAAELGLARHVHFTGFLRGAEVDRMYDEASLFVLPSVSEPFGIAPLEALARNVPVIVSRQSGVVEVLENVQAVDFWNVEELAERILDVLRRPDLAQGRTDEAREELRRLTWERQAGRVIDVYRELLA